MFRTTGCDNSYPIMYFISCFIESLGKRILHAGKLPWVIVIDVYCWPGALFTVHYTLNVTKCYCTYKITQFESLYANVFALGVCTERQL